MVPQARGFALHPAKPWRALLTRPSHGACRRAWSWGATCTASDASDAVWDSFTANAGEWVGTLARFKPPDMTPVKTGATRVTVTPQADALEIEVQRETHLGGPARSLFSRKQISDPLLGIERGESEGPWAGGLQTAVAVGGTMGGSYCMGPKDIQQELVAFEQRCVLTVGILSSLWTPCKMQMHLFSQTYARLPAYSLLLKKYGRRLRAICTFKLTMSGPCSPDFQLSLHAINIFQEGLPETLWQHKVAGNARSCREPDHLCSAPAFSAAVPLEGEVDKGRLSNLEGVWELKQGEFASAAGLRVSLPHDPAAFEDVDGVVDLVPWSDGTDTIGPPERTRETCHVPQHMSCPCCFAVRMPVEMRVGRPVWLEVLWLTKENGCLVRHSVRRVYDSSGQYLGSAFASFSTAQDKSTLTAANVVP